MDSPGAGTQAGSLGARQFPPLPKIWIGYLIGFVTLIAENVAAGQHPEIADGTLIVPPLYLFLPAFIGAVYWLVCVYQYHVVMNQMPGWQHPISPGKAVGYHFIPLYNLYWVFKWLQEIARFVNSTLGRPAMKPLLLGGAILMALLLRFLDAGIGMLLLFLVTAQVSAYLRQALATSAARRAPMEGPPPFS